MGHLHPHCLVSNPDESFVRKEERVSRRASARTGDINEFNELIMFTLSFDLIIGGDCAFAFLTLLFLILLSVLV